MVKMSSFSAASMIKALDNVFVRENGVSMMNFNPGAKEFTISLKDEDAPVKITVRETVATLEVEVWFSVDKKFLMNFSKTKVKPFEVAEIASVVLSMAKNNVLKQHKAVIK